MFRLIFVAFLGSPRTEAVAHAREAPPVMKWPLLVLAVPTVLAGFWGLEAFVGHHFHPGTEGPNASWWQEMFAPFGHSPLAAVGGLGALLFGYSAARACYQGADRDPLPEKLGVLSRTLRQRFYFDELYEKLIAFTHEALARLADWIDRWVIAGLGVRGLHGTTEIFGRALRLVQTGSLQTYAFLFVVGVVIVVLLALR
jgi:NADH-quinone oxidoreductase subunit L